jgi:hypothetical protein
MRPKFLANPVSGGEGHAWQSQDAELVREVTPGPQKNKQTKKQKNSWKPAAAPSK